jgi:DNA-binding transcriptional regulator YiaG
VIRQNSLGGKIELQRIPTTTFRSDRFTVRRARAACGLSQGQFGILLDASQPSVCGWESGKTKPSAHQFQIIKAILDHPWTDQDLRALKDAVRAEDIPRALALVVARG